MVYTGKISPKQPARVWFLIENTGLSLHEIARKHEISKSSVARMGNTTSDQRSLVEKVTRKSGRPRKISERDCRALIRGLQRRKTQRWGRYSKNSGSRKRLLLSKGPSSNVFSLSERQRIRLYDCKEKRNCFRKRPKDTSSVRRKNGTRTFKKTRLLQTWHCFLFRWCFFRSQAQSPSGSGRNKKPNMEEEKRRSTIYRERQ